MKLNSVYEYMTSQHILGCKNNLRMTPKELYDDYVKWCGDNNRVVELKRDMVNYLEKVGIVQVKIGVQLYKVEHSELVKIMEREEWNVVEESIDSLKIKNVALKQELSDEKAKCIALQKERDEMANEIAAQKVLLEKYRNIHKAMMDIEKF